MRLYVENHFVYVSLQTQRRPSHPVVISPYVQGGAPPARQKLLLTSLKNLHCANLTLWVLSRGNDAPRLLAAGRNLQT